jgi:sugar phosphate isomerase/epimerase
VRVGIVSDEISRDFAEALRIGTAVGIRRYEIRNLAAGRAPMCGDAAMIEAKRLASDAGVEITALSPGLFKLTEDEAAFRREMSEVYPRAAEWAHRWKLPGLIVFGFHKPGATEANFYRADPPPHIADWLAAAGERAASDGLVLMIEPEPICWCDTARGTAALIGRNKGLRINYDPGNVAWLENRDPLDDLDGVTPLIANVHMKDLKQVVAGVPEWVPAGEGMIDYAAHFRVLGRRGYAGPISLEPHTGKIAQPELRDFLERLITQFRLSDFYDATGCYSTHGGDSRF